MAGSIIGSVRLTPATAMPGQSVLAEALGPDGNPVDASVPVVINGIRGARQFLQFRGAGAYDVHAIAGTADALEATSTPITVVGDVWPDIAAPADGAAVALPSSVLRLPLVSATHVQADRSPYRIQFDAVDTDHFVENLARTYAAAPATAMAAAATTAAPDLVGDALAVTSYAWDFGDGNSASSTSGSVDHDFFASLAPDQEHHLFDITCTLSTKSGTSFAVKRTLSVVHAYAVCRNRGVVAPPVVGETHARKSLGAFEASIVVQNIESVPLTLTKRGFTYELNGAETIIPVADLPAPIALAANATTTVGITVSFATIPAEVPSFTVLFLGTDTEGRQIHVETHIDVALPDHRSGGLRYGRMAFTRLATTGISQFLTSLGTGGPVLQGGGATGGPGDGVGSGTLEGIGGSMGGVLGTIHHHPVLAAPVLAAPVINPVLQAPIAGIGSIGKIGLAAHSAHFAVDPTTEVVAINQPTKSVEITAVGLAGSAGSINFDPGLPAFQVVLGNDNLANAVLGNVAVDPSLWSHLPDDQKSSLRTSLNEVVDLARDLNLVTLGTQDGQPCDPDNRPDGIDEQWACQINQVNGQDDIITWHRHARFVNARKGDLILAPGGPAGFIGGLLRQVSPPQHYAHIGIMTRNYDMITHSTFSEERLTDHPNGAVTIPIVGSQPAPTDGFQPDVLKYGWPGVITQWVRGAVDTGRLADLAHLPAPGEAETEVDALDPSTDDNGNHPVRKLTPFNKYAAIGDDFEIIPPLVVKPDPLEETPAVRARLHQLADAAVAETGKSHYRFFCYTDPSIALTQTAPAEAGWAAGTYPTVCSSFIWLMMTRLGIPMEAIGGSVHATDLEPTDVVGGAEVTEGGHDGLYLYRAAERQAAGEWLHERLKTTVRAGLVEKARKAIGDNKVLAGIMAGLIELFSDIANDVANQMANTFASDWADTPSKDSENWKDVGDAMAVSPDNTMFWDGPGKGGVYGYAIPAAYSAPRDEQAPRYVWHFVPDKGVLHGTVRYLGNPVSRALVQVTDGLTAFTGNDGTYRLPAVPFGRYEVKVQYDTGIGGPIPGLSTINMSQVDQTLDFAIQAPQQWYRKARVNGDFYFMKYYVVGSNPRTDPPYHFTFEVPVTPDPGGTTAKWQQRADFHGIVGIASFLFQWQNDGVVNFNVTYVVSQDAGVIEDAANALSDAVEALSFGFISGLFGNEVNGGDSFGGFVDPNGPPADHGFQIGPTDGTQGRLSIHIENVDL